MRACIVSLLLLAVAFSPMLSSPSELEDSKLILSEEEFNLLIEVYNRFSKSDSTISILIAMNSKV